jgi:hypothetical protein
MSRQQEVVTEAQGRMRLAGIEEEKKVEQEANEEARKNRDFTQVYPKGWRIIQQIAEEGQIAALKLYTFLAEEMAWDIGAIVASQAFLAEKLGISTRTIKRACVYLESINALLRINLGKGTVQAYCLNPNHVWKSWDTKKDYAAFRTKTLTSHKDNPDIERKLKIMLKAWEEKGEMIGSEQPEDEHDLIAQPELKPEAETESTDKKETSLQKEAKKHQERKTREDLSKRKAQLLAELAEIEGEI